MDDIIMMILLPMIEFVDRRKNKKLNQTTYYSTCNNKNNNKNYNHNHNYYYV